MGYYCNNEGTGGVNRKDPGSVNISQLQEITLLGPEHILRRVLSPVPKAAVTR